jgi:hypothetical protein
MNGAATPHDLTSFEGRLTAACLRFDLTPPALTYDEADRAGGPLLTDDLLAWLQRPDVPMRWLFNSDDTPGDPLAQATAERRQREFLEIISRFDDEEVRLMVEAIEASQRGEMTLEEALEGWKASVESRRAEAASALPEMLPE